MKLKRLISSILLLALCFSLTSAAFAAVEPVTLTEKILGQGIKLPRGLYPTEEDGQMAFIGERIKPDGVYQTIQKRSAPDESESSHIGDLRLTKDRDVIVYANYNGYTLVEYGVEFFWVLSSFVESPIYQRSVTNYDQPVFTNYIQPLIDKAMRCNVNIPKDFIPASSDGIEAFRPEYYNSKGIPNSADKRSAPSAEARYDIGNIVFKYDTDLLLYGYYNGYALVSEGSDFYWILSGYIELK